MANGWQDLPAYGDGHWKAPVANAGSLPVSGNALSDARIDSNTLTVYVWNGSAWIPVATPGAAIAIDGLIGDVTASGPGVVPATVAFVGGESAANVASATALSLAATPNDVANTIVKRNASKQFSVAQILDETPLVSIDVLNRQLAADNNSITVDWSECSLASKNTGMGVSWLNGELFDASGNDSIVWATRWLTDDSNNTMLDWSGSAINLPYLTASTALVSDASMNVVSSVTTLSELAFVHGVTSNIQTQLNGKQSTISIGNLTDAGTDGITITGGTGAVIGSGTSLSQHVADTTHNGYLSSPDWNTFNGKQAAGNYITALTGDVTASGPGSVAATIANNAVTNSKAAQMAANTIKGNNTGSTANAADLTVAQVQALILSPVILSNKGTPVTSSGSQTLMSYTLPANQLLNVGDELVMEFYGDSSNGVETLTFHFGGQSITYVMNDQAPNDYWHFFVRAVKTSSNHQFITWEAYGAAISNGVTISSLEGTQTDTSTISISVSTNQAGTRQTKQRIVYYPVV